MKPNRRVYRNPAPVFRPCNAGDREKRAIQVKKTVHFCAYKLFFILILALMIGSCGEQTIDLAPYEITWLSPSVDEGGSMPLGNGDIGINAWVQNDGNLYFYIAKTDAWDAFNSLLKIGRIRVRFSPNPFENQDLFEQHLDLDRGQIIIHAGKKNRRLCIDLRVDATQPVVVLNAKSDSVFHMQVHVESWRHRPYEIPQRDNDQLIWAHHNKTSIWQETLRRQGMEKWTENHADPLLRNTFGCLVQGTGLVARDSLTLTTDSPRKHACLQVIVHTEQPQNIQAWKSALIDTARAIRAMNEKKLFRRHAAYWQSFWNRSWLIAEGTPEAETITRGYVLQRFISACAGRGRFPIKFNGSLFTVGGKENGYRYNADYRRWGGPYWVQNTRLIYWPMLVNGDFDLMDAFFSMYRKALPYARAATKRLHGHAGAFFPETMTFWGSYTLDNFGWDTRVDPFIKIKNQYIRYYYSGALEISAMMLDYYFYTLDEHFARTTLLPFVKQIVLFYDQHYHRDENGRLCIYPAQALEMYWDAKNPAPDVAGLQWVLRQLRRCPDAFFSAKDKALFSSLENSLPQLATGNKNGKTVVLAAEEVMDKAHNHENPELYAVFPFRIFGVQKPGLDKMRNSYETANVKSASGWAHYDVHAAYLGYVSAARELLYQRASVYNDQSRFPAFWGPNYDWTPDQDHGNNILLALQSMLIQTRADSILLLPAWPEEWDVSFKVHAPQKTVLRGEWKNGKMVRLEVTPERRKKDVIMMPDIIRNKF